MATEEDSASLVELVGRLASDLPDLFRKEADLGKAEAAAALRTLGTVSVAFAIAIGLVFSSTTAFAGALVSGLAALLSGWGMEWGVALAVSAATCGAILAVAAWLVMLLSASSLRALAVRLEQSAKRLSNNVARAGEEEPQ